MVIAMLFACCAQATSQGQDSFPEMIPYRIFVTLRADQQEAYIRELREMFVELSKESIGLFDEANSPKMAFTFSLFSEAIAEPFPAQGPQNRCANPVERCNEQREQRRRQFEESIRNGSRACIYAGMLSDYVNGTTRCRFKSEMTLQKVGGGSITLKCDRAPEVVLCNPLIFGIQTGSDPAKPHCVTRQMEATAACAAKSSAKDTSYFLRGVTRPGQSLEANQPYALDREWDMLRNWIRQICQAEGESRAFHCSECNTILRRLRIAGYAVWQGRYCDARDYELVTNPRSPLQPPEAVR